MTEEIKVEMIVQSIMAQVGPCLEQLVSKVNNALQDNRKLDARVKALENSIDQSSLAAMINDLQALQAQVKTLQYDVARLEYKLDGKAEPSPWANTNTK